MVFRAQEEKQVFVSAGLTVGNIPGRIFSKCPRDARCPE